MLADTTGCGAECTFLYRICLKFLCLNLLSNTHTYDPAYISEMEICLLNKTENKNVNKNELKTGHLRILPFPFLGRHSSHFQFCFNLFMLSQWQYITYSYFFFFFWPSKQVKTHVHYVNWLLMIIVNQLISFVNIFWKKCNFF